MWNVVLHKQVRKELDNAPLEIQEAFDAWVSLVSIAGSAGLQKVNGYWDHTLKGDWAGARSSSLSKQWRVIYVVEACEVEILVLRISAHDYRR